MTATPCESLTLPMRPSSVSDFATTNFSSATASFIAINRISASGLRVMSSASSLVTTLNAKTAASC